MADFLQVTVIGRPQLERKLKGLATALNPEKILDEGAAVLFNRMRTRFLDELDPTGTKWPRSKAAIKRAQQGRGGGTLFDIGRLFRSLQLFSTSGNPRAIGTNVVSKKGYPYPFVHQYGWANLPQRQFLGFGDEDVTIMSNVVLRRIIEGLAK